MRTTLTVDDDLAERLSELAHESKQSFRTVLNDTLRRGLDGSGPREHKFVLKPHRGNLRPGIDDRRLNELVWELDAQRVAPKRRRRP